MAMTMAFLKLFAGDLMVAFYLYSLRA